MRHRLGLRKLNRTSSHRLAMLQNMTNSLLRHEVIKTTLPKAKELRRVVEPIITLGKKPSLANRRLAFDRLRDREMVVKVFDELGPRYAKRNGGYLRILKFGFRQGDNAPMAYVELLDRPEEDATETQPPRRKAAGALLKRRYRGKLRRIHPAVAVNGTPRGAVRVGAPSWRKLLQHCLRFLEDGGRRIPLAASTRFGMGASR